MVVAFFFCIFAFFASYLLADQCPNGWIQSTFQPNKCYLVVAEKKNWFSSELFCNNAASGSHLTSICSAFENANIYATIVDTKNITLPVDHLWIGLNDIETSGSYQWMDGNSCPYKNWSPGQPDSSSNAQCVVFLANSNGKWMQQDCSTENYFVCEGIVNSVSATTPTATQATQPSTSKTSTAKITTTEPLTDATDCYDLYAKFHTTHNGIYSIYPPGLGHLSVSCNMETDGGGWTVFQRRVDGTMSFYDKTWNEYKQGFHDDLNGNMWLGNDYIHILSTKDSNVELRVDIWGDRAPGSAFQNGYCWEKYTSFFIDDESKGYTLYTSSIVTGNASISNYGIDIHNGFSFETIDSTDSICSQRHTGGWWSSNCGFSSLNGKYVPEIWHDNIGFNWFLYAYEYINPAQSRMMLRKIVGTDCFDLFTKFNIKQSGIQTIYPPNVGPIQVYCNMDADGGGWTVIQRRISGSLSFYNKTWSEYKVGFNDGLGSNLWLGNDNIHVLTTKDSNVELRIDLWKDRAIGSSNRDGYWFEKYTSFFIDNEVSNYIFHVASSSSGNASVTGSSNSMNDNNGAKFSTIDVSHDSCSGCCTSHQLGGWWLKQCAEGSLNGKYFPPEWQGQYGFSWYTGDHYINPAQSRMMIRKIVS